MQILEAYCEELGCDIDIYRAQREYFNLPAETRRRFVFRCSDKACRERNNTLVSGVNYNRLVEDNDKFRQMHFRAPKNHPHIPECIWFSERVQLDASPAEEHATRTSRAKKTNVIDVFEPREHEGRQISDTFSVKSPSLDDSDADADEDVTNTGLARHAHEGQTRTGIMERFVDCWLQFEGDELKQHYVSIRGQRLSYRQAVTLIRWLKPGINGQRVLYGRVRTSFWPSQNPTRVYINFWDECEQFDENLGKKTLTCEFKIKHIEESAAGALLLKKLDAYDPTTHRLIAFAWGTITPRSNQPGYQLTLALLENLVFKLVPKQNQSASLS